MGKIPFHTCVSIPKFHWKTGYENKNLFMGSCFTENIGQRMEQLKFQVDINPFGILYNPMSVAKGLRALVNPVDFSKNDLIEHNGRWHSFAHHGRFSSPNLNDALSAVNERLNHSSHFLKSTNYLFITFGTAWVYRYKQTNEVVANCHKIPSAQFNRERLTVEEVVSEYQELLSSIWKLNKNLKVIFTVSPIRHWKDGAVGNQQSKATLLLAVEQIVSLFPGSCAYFPSYEIVMDELRDYRYYAADMLHLNDVAVDYIWNVFEENLIDEASRQLITKIRKVNSALHHRPLNPGTLEYTKFLKSNLQNIHKLELDYPYLNLKLEKEHFIQQINKLGESEL